LAQDYRDSAEWAIDGSRTNRSAVSALQVHALPGKHQYTIRPLRPDRVDSISFDLDLTRTGGGWSSELTGLRNLQWPIHSAIPLQAWQPLTNRFAKVPEDTFWQDAVNIQVSDPTLTRIIKLAEALGQAFKGTDGIPDPDLSAMHPLGQLAYAKSGKSGLDCGNYSAIFTYLAERAGIRCRTIGTGKVLAGTQAGTHVCLECYLPETGEWALVDPLARNFLFRNGSGQLLNVVEVKNRCMEQDFSGITVLHYNGDSLSWQPFAAHAVVQQQYLHAGNSLTFYFTTDPENALSVQRKIKRYLLPDPWYALYTDSPGKNTGFLLRALSATVLLFSGVLLILQLTARRALKLKQ
jgi:hypothetical protein